MALEDLFPCNETTISGEIKATESNFVSGSVASSNGFKKEFIVLAILLALILIKE